MHSMAPPCLLDCKPPSKLSRLSSTLPSTLSGILPNPVDDTPSLLDYTLRSMLSRPSQVHSEYAPKYTSQYVNLQVRTPPSMFSSALPSMLSRTLTIAFDGTLPPCLTIRSQVSSQDAPKYTPHTLRSTPPSTFSSTLPGMLSRTLKIALDGTLLACLTVRSEVSARDALKHSPEHAPKYTPEARQSQSHLTICSHVCSWVLDSETCRVAGTTHRKAGGRRREAGGRRWEAGGGWWVAGGRWHIVAGIVILVDIIV